MAEPDYEKETVEHLDSGIRERRGMVAIVNLNANLEAK